MNIKIKVIVIAIVIITVAIGLTFYFDKKIVMKQTNQPMSEYEAKENFLEFMKGKLGEAKARNPSVEFTFDESAVTCTSNACKGVLVSKEGKSKGTSQISYTFIDGMWVDDEVRAMQLAKKAQEELDKRLGTANRYALSVTFTEGASLEVLVDGESLKSFKNPVATSDTTISDLLPLTKGKHEIEIRYSGQAEEWTYSYELKEFPIETDPYEALFDDSYIVSGSNGFVREKLNKIKSIKLQIESK